MYSKFKRREKIPVLALLPFERTFLNWSQPDLVMEMTRNYPEVIGLISVAAR